MTTAFQKIILVLSALTLPSLCFAGITKTVCANGKYRVCIEDPNTSYHIKLLSGEKRHLLDEIEPYELYLEKDNAFSFAYLTKELSDTSAGFIIKLECQEPRPGTCAGWSF